MGRRDQRNDGSVNNAQLLSAIHLQARVDTTTQSPGHHGARPSRVGKARVQNAILERSQQVRIALELGTRRGLDRVEALERLALEVGPRAADDGKDHLSVERVLDRVVLHDGVALGVGRVERDGAAGEGLLEGGGEGAGAAGEGELGDGGVVAAVLLGQEATLLEETAEEVGVLVDGGQEGAGVLLADARGDGLGLRGAGDLGEGQEGDTVAAASGVNAGLLGLVLSPSGGVIGGVNVEGIGVGHGLVADIPGHEDDGMILEVGADRGEVELGGDLGGLDDGLGANTGELQDLGSVDGAGGEDDLTGSESLSGRTRGTVAERDTRCGQAVLEENLVDDSAGEDLEVGAVGNGVVVLAASVRATALGHIDGAGHPESTNGISETVLLGKRDTRVLPRLPELLEVRKLEVGERRVDGAVSVGLEVVGETELLGSCGRRRLEGGALAEVWEKR